MKFLIPLLLWTAAACHAEDWKPADFHPKVFQMIDCWIADQSSPVVTEINLDAVRANRNQFDFAAVKQEDGWYTYREGAEMLRFKVGYSSKGEHSVVYQENGGGTFTTERNIRFTLSRRKLEVDGRTVEVAVLRVLAITKK